MAQWITTNLELGGIAMRLHPRQVVLTDLEEDSRPQIIIEPQTRLMANQFAIAFKQAAKCFEEMGRGLQ